MDNRHKAQKGFTLIEILIAITVFAIGVLAVVAMQSNATGSNSMARAITGSTRTAAEHIEFLMGLPYDDPWLVDTNGDGRAGLRSPLPPLPVPPAPLTPAHARPNPAANPADFQITTADNLYTIYWNIADNSPVIDSKVIRVTVISTGLGPQRTAALEFVKADL